MIILDILFGLAAVIAAYSAMRSGIKLVSAVIRVSFVSMVVSYFFLRMGAPDVAMTEAAIGAGLGMVIFLIAIRRTREDS